MYPARAWLASTGLCLVVACAPALSEPPPVSLLGDGSGSTGSELAGRADVDRLLAEAERQFTRYRLALALGQQARERPSTANDGLARMVALLEEVIEADPHLDRAGGDRVLALVLLRAPGWPAGSGDPDRALHHARRADALVPDTAENLLVLGEALAKTGAPEEARAAYSRAESLARKRASSGDPDAAELAESGARALQNAP